MSRVDAGGWPRRGLWRYNPLLLIATMTYDATVMPC
jgi:hypothetical protein